MRGLIRRNRSYVFNQSVTKAALATVLLGTSCNLLAFGDQWYAGVGGGISRLQPDPTDQSVIRDEENGSTAVIFFGRDFDNRSSGQIQLYSLGDAELSNGATVGYTAGDASVLYRFYDSRDNRADAPVAASLYGRFGFGFIDRESSSELANDVPIYFGAGAGVETYFSDTLGLRLEAMFHEADTASASLSVVGRFGGRPRLATRATAPDQAGAPNGLPGSDSAANPTPPPVRQPSLDMPDTSSSPAVPSATDITPTVPNPGALPEVWKGELPKTAAKPATDVATTAPSVEPELPSAPPAVPSPTVVSEASVPTVEIMTQDVETADSQSFQDTDKDGVANSSDQCPDSTAGYPVDISGCPLFSSLARQLVFAEASDELTSAAIAALNRLAVLLKQYPDARIEMVAHTDNTGTPETQSDLTRRRLRAMGMYLVKEGVSQKRLLLRSFGGKRPVYGNSTAEGRRANNRVEILENP